MCCLFFRFVINIGDFLFWGVFCTVLFMIRLWFSYLLIVFERLNSVVVILIGFRSGGRELF